MLGGRRSSSQVYRLDSYYDAVTNTETKRTGGNLRKRPSKRKSKSNQNNLLVGESANNLLDESLCEAAASNETKEFVALLDDKPSQLGAADEHGLTALHHACQKASMDVLAIILQRKPNLNAVDKHGETALHLAVRGGHCVVIELLLSHGAQGDVKNNKKMAAMHLAVQLQKYDCLRSLLKGNKIDLEVGGEFNMTPLHLAAILDDVTAAQILLDHGALLCKPCSLGLTTLHHAAKHASKKVINLVLELAEAKGYTREYLLSTQDKHKHSPLHLAINSGNTEPVKVVLEAGAHIDSKQDDGSTSVHLVCSQPGALETVKIMHNAQPDRFKRCLESADANGMTPLHRAVLFDFRDVAEYLISQGSPLNPRDCNGKTPMLLAASRQCWATVKLLNMSGADIQARDCDKSNFLHLAIKTGAELTELWRCKKSKVWTDQLNQEDIHGCTPLHYASKIGNIPSLVSLIDNGARVTCKDNSKQSPLHFAARYGRINTCRALLASFNGTYVINEVNSEGKTALHLASEFGHIKIVALLMQRGALLHRDHGGNSPLHLAAKQSYTQTIKLLLNVHPSLLNTENSEGNTPLHEATIANKPKAVDLLLTMGAEVIENQENRTFLDLAIERSHHEAALAVINNDRWKEIMMMPTHIHGSYLMGMVKYLPDMCTAALDRCTESSDHDPISVDYSVTYNFDLIRTDPAAIPSKRDLKAQDELSEKIHLSHVPMAALISMVKHERVQCLSHPVCLQFVKMKWSTVGIWLHLINLLVYALYLVCLTVSIILIGPSPTVYNTSVNSSVVESNTASSGDHYRDGNYYLPLLIVVLVFVGVNVLKEFAQMVQMKWRYFTELTNYIEWILYGCAAVYSVCTLLGNTSDWVYGCGVVGLFFSWINLLLVLQRFEFFGIYVVMFKEILATLLQVLAVFSILLFAFGVTFYALLRNTAIVSYSDLALSVMSSIVMMVGDINYVDTYVTPHHAASDKLSGFTGLTLFLLCLFILFIPILLMNLLIGLAVGDIEGVQKNARLKRLAMQVELTGDMEKKLPNFIIKRVNKRSLTEYPNQPCAAIKRWYESLVQGSDKDNGASQEKDELRSQLLQQKIRLKCLQADMKTQTELLKLVVAKMEIKTEVSALDEGLQDEDMDLAIILKQAASKSNHWRVKPIEEAVTKSQVVSMWQQTHNEMGQQFAAGENGCVKVSVTPVEADHVETNL